MTSYLSDYYRQAQSRSAQGIPPLPLTAAQTQELCDLLTAPDGQKSSYLDLLENAVPAGVDEAAKVKADFLDKIVKGTLSCPLISKSKAVEILGTMKGGYNVKPLIEALSDSEISTAAKEALEHTLLIYDAFDEVKALCEQGNAQARALMQSWADATWFESRPRLPDCITLKVFKVSGEATTDDFSPAQDAWSRPDIPLHAQSMFKNSREGLTPDEEGVKGPMALLASLKEEGISLVYAGDVVGTGSSRKSAANSLIWHIGNPIPGIPNKKTGGFVLGGKIAPIFYNTLEDSGALPVETDVSALKTGDVIDLKVYEGVVTKHGSDEVLASFKVSPALLDEVRAGGRINLIIGRSLTGKAREYLGLGQSEAFVKAPEAPALKGYTRAQKIVGIACGKPGIAPHEYCEPLVTTVGSQDTTGPMTRDELKDLACLKFSAPLVMQSFCHTAAYPKVVDIKTQTTLPAFMAERGGIALKPGDGIIHSFLNRMCLPNTVGTGGDSHTRLPLGISFAAGSGLVAFAAAAGTMPLDMPESVLVKFTGTRRPGITLRDLVHAIPYFAIKAGLLTVPKQGKINVFSGRILEIEGLEDLEVEEAFELTDASAERSAAACSIALNEEKVKKYLASNAALLRKLAEEGYECKETLLKRAAALDEAAQNYHEIKADPDCSYAAVLTINMDEITEPILCVPNDPDDARLLSECNQDHIDEVFIGSCMTNIGHFRSAAKILERVPGNVPAKLWMAPPTRMDQAKLREEGLYAVLAKAGARLEIPGCSLCMGNQARVNDNAKVISTSTRNFPNRLGKGAQVYLGSAVLGAVTATLGRLPSVEEYFEAVKVMEGQESSLGALLDFRMI